MSDSDAVAWHLNLDAELELADPGAYTPSDAVRAHVAAHEEKARDVMGAEDVLVHEEDRLPEALHGVTGRAWCMTPRARRILTAAGAIPEDAPPLSVLRAVNDRRFCAALGQELPGAGFVESVDAVERVLAAGEPRPSWLLKRAFAVAGRGQRRVVRDLGADDRRWLAASFRTGGVQVEPRVDIELETSTHCEVGRTGTVVAGEPHVQDVDASGVWRRTRAAVTGELRDEERRLLRAAALEAGRALASAGYFGPYGVDGYRWIDANGTVRLNARSEINARYTMGWALGIAGARE